MLSQWPKIAENIKNERKIGGVIKCNGNGKTDVNITKDEVEVIKEFPCSGKMIFDLRKRTMGCDTCGKILKFHNPDYWRQI